MAVPERVPRRPGGPDPGDLELRKFCTFRDRWLISSDLAVRLTILQERFPLPLWIISGYRTRAEQEQLEREGRPAAPFDQSTHTSCPATGADLSIGLTPQTDLVKAQFGVEVRLSGLRWGGGGPVDRETGIPEDWNHVDLGPRQS